MRCRGTLDQGELLLGYLARPDGCIAVLGNILARRLVVIDATVPMSGDTVLRPSGV